MSNFENRIERCFPHVFYSVNPRLLKHYWVKNTLKNESE